MSAYGAKVLRRMINCGSVSLCYKGSWAQAKIRGSPSEHLDEKKVFIRFVDLGLQVLGEEVPEESLRSTLLK